MLAMNLHSSYSGMALFLSASQTGKWPIVTQTSHWRSLLKAATGVKSVLRTNSAVQNQKADCPQWPRSCLQTYQEHTKYHGQLLKNWRHIRSVCRIRFLNTCNSMNYAKRYNFALQSMHNRSVSISRHNRSEAEQLWVEGQSLWHKATDCMSDKALLCTTHASFALHLLFQRPGLTAWLHFA